MTEMEHAAPPLAEPTPEKLHVERALGYVAKAIQLDLADIALNGEMAGTRSEDELRALRATLQRIGKLCLDTVGDITTELAEPQPTPLAPQAETCPPAPEKLPEPTPALPQTNTYASPNNGHTLAATSTTRAAEHPHLPERPVSADELYAAIIDPQKTPPGNCKDGHELIITITSDTTIRINGQTIVLTQDRLFSFNALMLRRDRTCNKQDLYGLGFRRRPSSRYTDILLHKTIGWLKETMGQAATVEVIKRRGNNGPTAISYSVNPAVVLIDQRDKTLPKSLPPIIDSVTAEDAERKPDLVRPAPYQPSEVWAPEQVPDESELSVTFQSDRELHITTLSKAYRSHIDAHRRIAQWRKDDDLTARFDTDSLRSYGREASNYRLLTKEDEVDLFTDIENGLAVYDPNQPLDTLSPEQVQAFVKLAAAHQIVFFTNMRLVISIAKRLWHVLPPMALIHAGNEGLARAITRFTVGRGLKFSTYATYWIRQGMQRAVVNEARTIRLPDAEHTKFLQASKQVNEAEQKRGRALTDAEIEAETGLRIAKYRELMRVGAFDLPSLNMRVGNEDGVELGELIADPDAVIDKHVTTLTNQTALQDILGRSQIDDTGRFIIGLRYGLSPETVGPLEIILKGRVWTYEDAWEALDQETDKSGKVVRKAIGDLLGMSGERIRQLEEEAMEPLRVAASSYRIEGEDNEA